MKHKYFAINEFKRRLLNDYSVEYMSAKRFGIGLLLRPEKNKNRNILVYITGERENAFHFDIAYHLYKIFEELFCEEPLFEVIDFDGNTSKKLLDLFLNIHKIGIHLDCIRATASSCYLQIYWNWYGKPNNDREQIARWYIETKYDNKSKTYCVENNFDLDKRIYAQILMVLDGELTWNTIRNRLKNSNVL